MAATKNTQEQQRSYAIGQVVFVLSENAQKIVPVRIVEEITIKKLDGNHTTFKVAVGPKGKEKVVESARLNGELYTTLDEIKEVLKKRLSAFLNQIITDAEDRTLKWYGQQQNKEISAEPTDDSKIDPENLLDSFDDSNKQKSPLSKKQLTQEELRKELRRNLSEPDELLDTGEDRGMVELPDGTVVKARLKFNENG